PVGAAAASGKALRLDPARPEDFLQACRQASESAGNGSLDVVYLWGLDTPEAALGSASLLIEAQETGCRGLLHLVQALTPGAAKSARLWVATRGAQAVAGSSVAVAQAPIWGLGRTIALEHPELECVSVDLDPSEGTEGIAALADEIESRSREDRVAFRDRRRLVARLVRSAPPAVGGHRVPAPDS